VFVGIIAAVVVLCGGAVAVFAVFAVLGAADEAASRPTAEIVTCELVHVAAWQMAEVTWKVENNDNREREWFAHITVHDGADLIVGEGGAQVVVAAGDTRTIDSEILLIAPGREITPGEQSCNIELKDSFLD
jgi:hypothetical protein